jgi:hypothetical protein
VVSNGARGIWVRDSRRVVAFNNLVYANRSTGIDFGGENGGSPDGTAVNNYGLRQRARRHPHRGPRALAAATVVQNVIAQNLGSGINLKERSADGFVGQWNLNIDGYGSEATKSAFDFSGAPLLVAPSGGDQQLGIPFHADDDFRLRQLTAGQPEQSSAVDGSPMTSRWLQLAGGSTSTAALTDQGRADLGFHYGNVQDFASGRKSVTQRGARACANAAPSASVSAGDPAAARRPASAPRCRRSATSVGRCAEQICS